MKVFCITCEDARSVLEDAPSVLARESAYTAYVFLKSKNSLFDCKAACKRIVIEIKVAAVQINIIKGKGKGKMRAGRYR